MAGREAGKPATSPRPAKKYVLDTDRQCAEHVPTIIKVIKPVRVLQLLPACRSYLFNPFCVDSVRESLWNRRGFSWDTVGRSYPDGWKLEKQAFLGARKRT